ncbi:fimbria/pilus outer membrane usher protein [Leptolyngbya sp. CCNP1308]|uniref:fimbria/pilus outer membrane usher protein n=1 Tax=Leptolyngbya sp. CCNP1308 TaxID=3110255 RepID=UPI002B1F2475|nr:fimbria/pilus outer membrane usher protein [Leptolyngbya sp. CCNP1308]MEA5448719.1 fimbria/pilus outer membrane usher protein [Leptolyngbya sp. CCNP1308]
MLTPYLLTATTATLPVNPLPPPSAEAALTAAAEALTPPQIAVAPNPEATGGHALVSGLPAPQPSFSTARQPLAAVPPSLAEATVQAATLVEQQFAEPQLAAVQTKNANSMHPGARPSAPELGLDANQAAWSPKVATSAHAAALFRPEPATPASAPLALNPEPETLVLEAEIPNAEPAAPPVEPENQPEPSTPESATPAPAAPEPETEILDSDPGNSSPETEAPEAEPDATATEAPASESTEESAETEAELFERIFGRPPPQDQAIAVPFFINDQPQGQAIVVIAEGSASQVQAAPVLDKTATILQPDLQSQLAAIADSEGYLPLDQLQQLGIEVVFDQTQLELYLQIPAALRRTNVVGVTGLPPEAADALPVSNVSGYLNILAGEDIVWSGSGSTGRQPLRIALDGALNVSGWVLEGRANVIEGGTPGFSRGDVRLVHDDPVNALRYMAGDLSIPVSGAFQTVVPLGGISVSRNYSLQPYRVTRPTGEFTFFLERPARVEIYINGVRVQQLQLEAGPQDIRNLALSTGANDIQLVITDDLGQVQRLDFATALAGNLLAPGLQQFSYNLGFPTRTLSGQRQYQWDEPQLALAHRWGVSPTVTLGGYAQLTPSYQMVETDGVWASAVGNWGWDVAASHTSELGTGLAMRLQYELPPSPQDASNRSLRIAAEYRGDRFTTFGSLSPSADWLTLSAAYSQRIFDNTSLNIGGGYRLGRDGPDSYTANLGLSRSLGNGLSGSLNLNHSRNQQGQNETRAFLGLSWLMPQRRQSVALNTTVSSTEAIGSRLSWSRSPDRRLQSPGLALDLNRGGQGYDLSGRLTYTDYRFDLGLTHDVAWPTAAAAATSNTTRLTFGTALVFADGHFGWSRPITNSFVLVVPRDRWRGQTIGVNPSQEGYGAVVDGLGPAVLPDLQPYYVSRLRLEAPEAPLGYDLGTDEYVIMPSYRSGTLIMAGTEASAFVRGVLVDEAGAPLGLQAGEVVSLSDADWAAQPLFTNRIGRFALLGFTPGMYEIRLRDRAPLQFEITPDQEGIIDLGTLQIGPS